VSKFLYLSYSVLIKNKGHYGTNTISTYKTLVVQHFNAPLTLVVY